MSVAKSVLAGRAVVELGLRDKLTAALKSAKKRLESFGKTLNVIGAGLIGASGAVLGPMSASLLVFASYGDHLAKMAARLGLTTEALSELGHAAGLSGANTESLEKGIRKFHQNLTDAASGSVASAQAFESLGISVAEISNLPTEDALEVIADRISAIQDPAKRTAAAIDLFGRSGAELLPLLLSGSKGIRGMRQEARDLGLSLSGQTAVDAEKLTDALSRVQLTLKALTINVGAALAPLVTELANKFAYATGKAIKFIQQNQRLVAAIAFGAVAIGAAGVAFVALGTMFLVAAKGVGLLITALASVQPIAGLIAKGFMIVPKIITGIIPTIIRVFGSIGRIAAAIPYLFNPVGIGVALIGSLLAAWLVFTDEGGQALSALTEVFNEVLSVASFAFGGILKALQSGDWKLAVSILMAGLKAAFVSGLSSIINVWPKLAEAVQKSYANIGKYTGSIVNSVVWLFTNSGRMIVDMWNSLPDFIRVPLELIWVVVQEVFTRGIAWLNNAWTEFSIGLVSIFDGFVTGIRQAWNNVTLFIIQTIAKAVDFVRTALDEAAKYDPTGAAAALRDSIGDVTVLAKVVEEDIQRQNKQFGADKQERDLARGERVSRQKEESDRQIQEIVDKRNDLVQQLLKGLDVEAAKQELADLVRKASEPADKQTEKDAEKKAEQERLAGVNQYLDSLSAQAKSATTRGTFTSGIAAFQQLAAGGVQDVQKRLLERIAKATEATAENTEEMSDSPGLAFQE